MTNEFTYENDPSVYNNQYDYEVNAFQNNAGSEMAKYERLVTQGKCFRLPATATIPDELYQSWLYTFMTEVKDDVNEISKHFRYTWCDEEENADSGWVAYGIPGSAGQVVKMMKSGQVTSDMLDPAPSSALWTKCLKVTNENWSLIKVMNDEKNQVKMEATAVEVRKVFDQIINLWTDSYYESQASSEHGGTPGGVSQVYFDNHKKILPIMRAANAEGNKFLPVDMVTSFNKGVYKNYRQVLAAVKRRYGRCQTQDTMMDFFRKLDVAFSRKTRHEFKIQELRNVLDRQYITQSSEFPNCSDFEDDFCKQKRTEEYNPIINTLLTYIIFKSEIPKTRWDGFQKEFYALLGSKPSYKTWHENRKELWMKLDEEMKLVRKESINNIGKGTSENNDDDDDDDDIEEMIALLRKKQANRKNAGNRNRNWSQTKNNNSTSNRRFTPNFKTNTAGHKKQSFSKPNKAKIRQRAENLLCYRCSRIAGVNKYHEGPMGPEANCPYDKDGRLRPGKRFISHIYGDSINELDIPEVNQEESEVYQYEKEEDEQTEVNQFGVNLLSGALHDYGPE